MLNRHQLLSHTTQLEGLAIALDFEIGENGAERTSRNACDIEAMSTLLSSFLNFFELYVSIML